MVVAPAGTTATWLNAGLRTRPAGCRRVISMASTVPQPADTSLSPKDVVVQVRGVAGDDGRGLVEPQGRPRTLEQRGAGTEQHRGDVQVQPVDEPVVQRRPAQLATAHDEHVLVARGGGRLVERVAEARRDDR